MLAMTQKQSESASDDYVVLYPAGTIAFAASSLAEAVEIKNDLQVRYNEMRNCDEVFQLRKVTRAEVQRFSKSATHFTLTKPLGPKH